MLSYKKKAAPSIPPLLAIFRESRVSTSNNTSYTFTSVALGPASPLRRVVVSVASLTGTSNRLDQSVTVNGISLSLVVRKTTPAGNSARAAIYSGLIPDGISANIIVTFNGSVDCCGIGVWTMSARLADSVEGFGESGNNTVVTLSNITDKMCAIAVVRCPSTSTENWSGATEDFGQIVESGATRHSGASINFTQNLASHSISPNIADIAFLCVALFR